jgi:hypothetical protein
MTAVYKKQKEGPQAWSCFSDRQTGLLRTYNVVITNSEIPWECDYLTCDMEYIIFKSTVLDNVTHDVENKGNKGTNTVILI